jgi:hypothetical protein
VDEHGFIEGAREIAPFLFGGDSAYGRIPPKQNQLGWGTRRTSACIRVSLGASTEVPPEFSIGIHKELLSSTGCAQRECDLRLSAARRSGKVFDIKCEKF